VATRAKRIPSADYETAAAVREALRVFQRRTDAITAEHGLTSRIYQLLLMIKTGHAAPERASLVELEERLQLGKSTVTELVVRAERRGLVRRELDPDRRGAIRVCLTSAGERKLGKACAQLGDERRRLVELLSQLDLDRPRRRSGSRSRRSTARPHSP
jgi:DNA-binding MarR family transcriptional regulator